MEKDKRPRLLLWRLCREIRIQSGSMKVDGIYSGFNTLTGMHETWKCISINQDHNKHILEKINS